MSTSTATMGTRTRRPSATHARSNDVDLRRPAMIRTSGDATSRPLTTATTDDSRAAATAISIPFRALRRSRDVCTKRCRSELRELRTRYGVGLCSPGALPGTTAGSFRDLATCFGDSNRSENEKNPRFRGGFSSEKSGGNLLSQGVYPQVPSARSGLTSVFGMGTGVTPTLWPPETCRPSTRVTRRRGLQSKHEHNPSPRPISTGQLHRLPCFHFRPINVVVSPRALLR